MFRPLFFFALVLLPLHGFAADIHEPYPARLAARRAGDVTRIVAQAQFMNEHRDLSLSSESAFQQMLCALRLSMPYGRGGAFSAVTAKLVGAITHRDAGDVVVALTRSDTCVLPLQQEQRVPSITAGSALPLDREGRPLSRNPVWNACVRGGGLSVDLLRTNTDVFLHRQRRTHLAIPWSCRDYHRGPVDVWQFPDIPGTEILLDRRGRFLQVVSVPIASSIAR